MTMTSFTVQFNRLKGMITTYANTTIDQFKAVKVRINSHTVSKGNVHGLEPADIGLGNVPDWLPATTPQAQSGLSNSAFMTPRRTDDYVIANVYGPLGEAFLNAANEL